MLYVILNPNASRGQGSRRESAIRAALKAAELPFELVRTEHPGHAQRLAADAAGRDQYTALVAAGGDGTINEIVNGMRGSTTPLGFIPIGTGNDLVKMLDLPPNQPQLAAQRLRAGTIRTVDIGIANGSAFINGVGCGFDAQITVESKRPTRLRGFAIYLGAMLRALGKYKSPVMRVHFDGQTIEQRMLLTTIGNGRCHGGGFWVTPAAQFDDGLLDLCVCHHMHLGQIMKNVPKVLNGTHTTLPQVRMARVTAIQVEMLEPVPVHLDGELIGTGLQHLQAEIEPGALRLLA